MEDFAFTYSSLQIEAKMGFEGDEASKDTAEEMMPASAADSADLSFMNEPFGDAEGDWSFD